MIYFPSYSSIVRNPRYSNDDSHPKFTGLNKDPDEIELSSSNPSDSLPYDASWDEQKNQRKTYLSQMKGLRDRQGTSGDNSSINLIVKNLSADQDLEQTSQLWINRPKNHSEKVRRDSCGCPLTKLNPSDSRFYDHSLIQPSQITSHIKSPVYSDVYFDNSVSENSSTGHRPKRLTLKRSNSRHLLKKKNTIFFKRIETLKRRRNASQHSQNIEAGKIEEKKPPKLTRENALSFRPQLMPDEDSDCDASERITLNVSGMRFETWVDILQQHPTTLLGNPKKRAKYYDENTSEYFFDRHRPTFEAIFNYYQYGGRIKRPHNIPDDIFLDELDFYEIEPEIIAMYKKSEGYVFDTVILPENKIKRVIWQLFEIPDSSKLAYFFAIMSVLFTIISIISFCLETLPNYENSHCDEAMGPNFYDKFFIMESICTFWFTVEVIARFFSCPCKKQYMLDPRNYVDIVAIFPYYLTLIQVLSNFSCSGARSSASLAFLRVIRLVRVFKLTKHSAGLQVLILTFKESIEGLSLFLVALMVCIVVFSSAIYYAEQGVKDSEIGSIPDAFWWAVITMCTVGYGDKYPKGPWGKLIGSVCAVAGVLTLAIPVPIITENFNKFYSHKKSIRRP